MQDVYPCAASALDRMALLMDLSASARAAWWDSASIEDVAEFYHGSAQTNEIIFDVLLKELDNAVRRRWPDGEFVPVYRAHQSEQASNRSQRADTKAHVMCALTPLEIDVELKQQLASAEARETDARKARDEWAVARQDAKRAQREAASVIATVQALLPKADLKRAIQNGMLRAAGA